MTGNITNHLCRLLRPRLPAIIHRITAHLRMFNRTHNTKLYTRLSSRNTGKKRTFIFFPYRSAKPITQFIRKDSDIRHTGNISFHGQRIRRILRSFSSPAFSINANGRINLVDSFPDFVHRLDVVYSHEVKAEAVNMIFINPVKDRFYHKFTHHRTFTCSLIAASRAICQRTIFFPAIKVTGSGTFKVTLYRIERMVVHYVHYHSDTCLM